MAKQVETVWMTMDTSNKEGLHEVEARSDLHQRMVTQGYHQVLPPVDGEPLVVVRQGVDADNPDAVEPAGEGQGQ